LLRLLIEREFGVLYNRHYVCDAKRLRNLGYSFQKARFVSDHLDEAARQAWLQVEWPRLLQAARQQGAKIMFGDEATRSVPSGGRSRIPGPGAGSSRRSKPAASARATKSLA
jgi:hypothetical protein